jgi:transcriptional regulator with AAA-type ATPase domain
MKTRFIVSLMICVFLVSSTVNAAKKQKIKSGASQVSSTENAAKKQKIKSETSQVKSTLCSVGKILSKAKDKRQKVLFLINKKLSLNKAMKAASNPSDNLKLKNKGKREQVKVSCGNKKYAFTCELGKSKNLVECKK